MTVEGEEEDRVGIPIGHQPWRPASKHDDWLHEMDTSEYQVYQPSNVYEKANSQNPCASNQFRCTTSNVCIPLHLRCDGFYHCNDMSDEKSCEQYQRHTTTRRPLTLATPTSRITTQGPGLLERRNTTTATEASRWPWATKTTTIATTTSNPITTVGVASRCP